MTVTGTTRLSAAAPPRREKAPRREIISDLSFSLITTPCLITKLATRKTTVREYPIGNSQSGQSRLRPNSDTSAFLPNRTRLEPASPPTISRPSDLTLHHRLRAQVRLDVTDVRFGSKADIHGPQHDVRFTPKNGHGSEHPGSPLSATSRHRGSYSITSSDCASSVGGTVRPSIRAVWELMTNSNLDACIIGRSTGRVP